jgi:hypothetical protein
MTPPDFSAWICQAKNPEFQIQAGRGKRIRSQEALRSRGIRGISDVLDWHS